MMDFTLVQQQIAVCLLAMCDESELGREFAGNSENVKAELPPLCDHIRCLCVPSQMLAPYLGSPG